jgi:predicted transcriptional regulator
MQYPNYNKGVLPMTTEEIKRTIKEKHIDRRDLAKRLGIGVMYLNQILNGWAPMKDQHEKAIKEVFAD